MFLEKNQCHRPTDVFAQFHIHYDNECLIEACPSINLQFHTTWLALEGGGAKSNLRRHPLLGARLVPSA